MPRACLITYGCQMNVHDSEIAAGQLARLGYDITDDPGLADAVFVNTCTVREHAKQKGLARIASLAGLKHRRPGVFLAAMGCVASEERDALKAAMPFLDAVIPTDQITQVAKFLSDAREDFGVDPAAGSDPFLSADTPRLRFSSSNAYVTLVTGCNMDCTYCIVPATRGRERSRPMSDVIREVSGLAAQGYAEIMFLGQTVNAYGDDLLDPAANFTELLRRADAAFPNGRIRFLSPHPKRLSEDLIAAWPGLHSLCEHIHLPAQSGSDRVLRRMKRLYTRAEYERKVEALRRAVPGIAVTTDIMVGFPGETEEEFRETLAFCESVRFDAAYMYMYSPRSGTAALNLKDAVPREVSLERHGRLVETQTCHSRAALGRQIGRVLDVLLEAPGRSGGVFGKSREWMDVVVDAPQSWIGRVVSARIESVAGKTLKGRPASELATPPPLRVSPPVTSSPAATAS